MTTQGVENVLIDATVDYLNEKHHQSVSWRYRTEEDDPELESWYADGVIYLCRTQWCSATDDPELESWYADGVIVLDADASFDVFHIGVLYGWHLHQDAPNEVEGVGWDLENEWLGGYPRGNRAHARWHPIEKNAIGQLLPSYPEGSWHPLAKILAPYFDRTVKAVHIQIQKQAGRR